MDRWRQFLARLGRRVRLVRPCDICPAHSRRRSPGNGSLMRLVGSVRAAMFCVRRNSAGCLRERELNSAGAEKSISRKIAGLVRRIARCHTGRQTCSRPRQPSPTTVTGYTSARLHSEAGLENQDEQQRLTPEHVGAGFFLAGLQYRIL